MPDRQTAWPAKKIVPVILSGGSGVRLWPLSRLSYPKQFLNLSGSGQTLFQETAERVRDPELFEIPLVVCNEEHRFVVAEQLGAMGIASPVIILEPEARNTAAALAIAALAIEDLYGDCLMLALPSDHMMEEPERFRAVVCAAAVQALEGNLVTFGITPGHAATGYGYIHQGECLDALQGMFKVTHFVEKPDSETAQHFIECGDYLWNSGIFLFSVSACLKEMQNFAPDILEPCRRAFTAKTTDLDFIRLDPHSFMQSPSLSIDYALMEHTQKAVVTALGCVWRDVGDWQSLWQVADKDEAGNAASGDTHIVGTRNSYIRGEGAPVHALGVEDLIIISTHDAVLVAHKDAAQDIKAMVETLQRKNPKLANSHRRVYRPWGYYETINADTRYQIKRIIVKPGGQLSLQIHRHRAEHWVIIEGTAKVQLDDKEEIISQNQAIYVPCGSKHRLENVGESPLEIIEIQSGSYLGEDDIVRLEDRYGRIKEEI